jgi:hypothetical protein
MPARVAGMIAAELSVHPHLLQTILQAHISDLLREAVDRFDPAALGGERQQPVRQHHAPWAGPRLALQPTVELAKRLSR